MEDVSTCCFSKYMMISIYKYSEVNTDSILLVTLMYFIIDTKYIHC